MLNSLPLATGPKEAPGGGRTSLGPGSKSPRPGSESRDSFASTLNAVRGEKDPTPSADRAPTRANPEDKPEAEGNTSPKRPGDAEALESQNVHADAQEPQTAQRAGEAGDAAPGGTDLAGPAVQVSEGAAATETANSGRPVPTEDARDGAGQNGAGKNGKTAAAGETARAGKTGAGQILSNGAVGKGPNGASDADRSAVTKTGASEHADVGTRPMEAKQAAAQGRIDGTAGENAAAQGAPGSRAGQAAGDPDGSATKRPVDMAQRPSAAVPGQPPAIDSRADSGNAGNTGGRSENPEALVRQAQSGERNVEGGRRFGEMVMENASRMAKEDPGPLASRQGGQEAFPTFSTLTAPKAAAAANGGASAAPPSTAESFARDNFHQLVERAVFSVRGGHSEARIALKPDQLGHIRMQIVTENQAVSIKIVAESPVSRDLIDANAHQLRSELQQQGLNVQTIEVAVSDDDRQDAYRGARQREAFPRQMAGRGAAEEEAPAVAPGSAVRQFGQSSAAGIDYFA